MASLHGRPRLWSRQVEISDSYDATGSNGDWQDHPGGSNGISWVSTTVSAYSSNGPSALFAPDIAVDGNYTVFLYTPGCSQENTCDQRGTVNVTCWQDSAVVATTSISQTNEDDRNDQIYRGKVNSGSGGDKKAFTIILAAAQDQTFPVEIVAQYVQFNGSFNSDGSGNSSPSSTTSSTHTSSATGSATPAPDNSSPQSASSSSSSNSLSGGAIAGIVIGSVAVILIAVIAFFFLRRSRKHTSPASTKETPSDASPADPSNNSELYSPVSPFEASGVGKQVFEMPGREHHLSELSQPPAIVHEADNNVDAPPPLRPAGRS